MQSKEYFEYIDMETVKIMLATGKTMTAKLNTDGTMMTIDKYKGESLTLKNVTPKMENYVCHANPKACDVNYPFSK